MNRLITVILLVFSCYSTAVAESSVWRAQKGDSVIYLGGTIHILRASDYPLPAEFDKAYKAADILVFEIDIGLLKEPAAQMKFLQGGVYSDGSTIDMHLSPGVYAELNSYCIAKGVPLQQFSRLRPAMLMMVLTMMELQRLGITVQGVDSHYYDLAKKDKKEVKGLETVDEQLNYLISSADGHEDEFVSYSLKDLQNTSNQLEVVTTAWRKGDSARIDELMTTELKMAAPYLYKKLVTERNKNWMTFMAAAQPPRRTLFVLVGVAHLAGQDGLVEMLRKSGYKVVKL